MVYHNEKLINNKDDTQSEFCCYILCFAVACTNVIFRHIYNSIQQWTLQLVSVFPLDMCRYISRISRSTISAYFGVSPYRDICWTIGDPLSRYCKPVVTSCGKQKIASTHSHMRAQQVWHSLTITHVALQPHSWHLDTTHRGSGVGDIGDSGSALWVYCSCHAPFPYPLHIYAPLRCS